MKTHTTFIEIELSGCGKREIARAGMKKMQFEIKQKL